MDGSLGDCFHCQRGLAEDDIILCCIEPECRQKLCYSCFADMADDNDVFCEVQWRYFKFNKYLAIRIFVQESDATHEYEFMKLPF